MNPFKAIGGFFKSVFGGGTNDVAAHRLELIQSNLAMALDMVKLIDTMIPNRSTEEVMALASKYGLETVTPEMISDPVIRDKVIHAAALKGLRKVSTADDSILDAAISLALNVAKSEG